MASTIKSKYALIDKKRISQKAQDVLNDIADATDNFKKVSPQLRKEFNTFYDKLKAAKPEAIKGTKEYKEFGKEGAPQPKATPEPSDALKNAIKKARELRKAQGIRYDRDSIERDAARPALKAGKRKSKDGNTYYEYRENRIDRKPAKYPKLSHGGKPLSYFTYETPMVTILWNGKAQPLGRFKSAQEALDEIRKVSGGIESEMLRYSIKTPDDVIPVKDVLFAGGGKASGKYTVYLYFGGENPSETHHVASLKEAKSLAKSAEHAEIIDSNGDMVEFSGYDDDEDGGEMKVEISNDFRGGKGKSTATLNGKRISVDEANRLIKENNLKLAEDTMYSNVAWKTYTKSGKKFAGGGGVDDKDKLEEAMYALHYMIASNSFTQDGVKNVRSIINQHGTDEQKQLMSEIPAVGFHTRTDEFSKLYYSLKKSVQGNEYAKGGKIGLYDLVRVKPSPENKLIVDTEGMVIEVDEKDKMALVRTDINRFNEKTKWYKLSDLTIAKGNETRLFEEGGSTGQGDLFNEIQTDTHRNEMAGGGKPKMVRTIFEEEEFEYAKGGIVEHGLKHLDIVHNDDRFGNDTIIVTNTNGETSKYTISVVNLRTGERSLLKKDVPNEKPLFEALKDVDDNFALGGRPKSALMRDRAYQSEEKWEKNYSRVGRPKHPKYKYDDGGGVSAAEMLSIRGSWKITAYDTNRGMRADISMPAPFDVTVKRLNRMLANSEWNFLTQHHIERA